MEDISIFTDKSTVPTDKDLVEKLESTYTLWMQLADFVMQKYPDGRAEWNYPGKKYGWSFRIKDKKRAIIYFLPRDKYFMVAFVFGQKATDMVLNSTVAQELKTNLEQSTKYAEGRGIRIAVENDSLIPDIQRLIEIKIAN